MATSLDPETAKRMERRERVLIGELPHDFLRVGNRGVASSELTTGKPLTSQQIQEQMDEQAALALHHQLNAAAQVPVAAAQQMQSNIRGRLLISVIQAKLVKNYGMTRMDPYVRIHVGHNIYETPTDVNGAKNPRWNKTIQCFLPMGINQIYMEIYDECNFSVDELIAQTTLNIPEEIFKGETIEKWYPLSGKQGDEKEGQILLVFSFMKSGPVVPLGPGAPLVTGAGGMLVQAPGAPKKGNPPVFTSGKPVASQIETEPAVVQPKPEFNEEDFNQMKEMFPNMDDEVIKSVYEAKSYNKDATASALLEFAD